MCPDELSGSSTPVIKKTLDGLGANRIVKGLSWYGRLLRKKPPVNPSETFFRLRRLSSRSSGQAPRIFSFSWGQFEFLSEGNLQSQYKEIFLSQNYAFESKTQTPVILDCGGNVGLSVVWFKQQYPESQIEVYEPDPSIAEILKRNIGRLKIRGVKVIVAGVWIKDGRLGFRRGAPDSGSLDAGAEDQVEVVRLASRVPPELDLLKLDIEGAEFEVIEDLCRSSAISRVKKLIAECHVTNHRWDVFIEILKLLRSQGMEIVLGTAQPKRAFGGHLCPTPFPGITGGHCLVNLYAWRQHQ